MASPRPGRRRSTTAPVEDAKALTDKAPQVSQLIRATVDSLIKTNEQITQASSEALGGLLGTSLGAGGGILLVHFTSASNVCVPLTGAAGAAMGVLAVRIIEWRHSQSVNRTETVTTTEPTLPQTTR